MCECAVVDVLELSPLQLCACVRARVCVRACASACVCVRHARQVMAHRSLMTVSGGWSRLHNAQQGEAKRC
eukprot:6173774-Pleurochrysis_carterae.AAC.1